MEQSKNKISFSSRVKDELRKKDFTAYEKVINIGSVDSRDLKTRSYIRECFLNSGSVTDPKKDYHLEFVCEGAEDADRISDGLCAFQLEPRIMERNGHLVVYLKDAEQISDVLNLMGAVDGLMEFENVRILKEVSEKVNRRVNCETANLNRTAVTAVRQIEDIQYIGEHLGFGKLAPPLRQMAEVRLQFPEASLKELGEAMDPVLGKSGVNHRLRKLSEIADKLREEKV